MQTLARAKASRPLGGKGIQWRESKTNNFLPARGHSGVAALWSSGAFTAKPLHHRQKRRGWRLGGINRAQVLLIRRLNRHGSPRPSRQTLHQPSVYHKYPRSLPRDEEIVGAATSRVFFLYLFLPGVLWLISNLCRMSALHCKNFWLINNLKPEDRLSFFSLRSVTLGAIIRYDFVFYMQMAGNVKMYGCVAPLHHSLSGGGRQRQCSPHLGPHLPPGCHGELSEGCVRYPYPGAGPRPHRHSQSAELPHHCRQPAKFLLHQPENR